MPRPEHSFRQAWLAQSSPPQPPRTRTAGAAAAHRLAQSRRHLATDAVPGADALPGRATSHAPPLSRAHSGTCLAGLGVGVVVGVAGLPWLGLGFGPGLGLGGTRRCGARVARAAVGAGARGAGGARVAVDAVARASTHTPCPLQSRAARLGLVGVRVRVRARVRVWVRVRVRVRGYVGLGSALLAGLTGGAPAAEARVYLGRVGSGGSGFGVGAWVGYRVEARTYLVLAMLRIGIEQAALFEQGAPSVPGHDGSAQSTPAQPDGQVHAPSWPHTPRPEHPRGRAAGRNLLP